MKLLILFFLILIQTTAIFQLKGQQSKPRIVVLTDIENEPDDAESMVRYLTYANQFDTEALIATTSTHLRDKIADWRIREIVTAYGKVRDNLLRHEPGYPAAESLLSLIKKGIPKYGMDGVGPGQDSEGSDWLIRVVDKEDPRPVWVTVWGGPNVLAQALYKVRQTRTPAELQEFVEKIRVYTISDQDNSAAWIRKNFPRLFYIVSPGGNYYHATWSGISGEPWYGFASGADTTLVKNNWLRENVRENHGPLGAEYPAVEYAMEGDTPSFLYLVNNGLNVPERPDFGGWGGRYEFYQPRFLPYRNNPDAEPETRPIWTDAVDQVTGKDGRIYADNHATIWRWRDAYQNDFAARMDWCVRPFGEANHPPAVKVDRQHISLKPGEGATIDASQSSDPDRQSLNYRWFIYTEAGNYWHWRGIQLQNAETSKVTVTLPKQAQLETPKYTHLILEVTDNGNPALTRYQRVVVNLMPGE